MFKVFLAICCVLILRCQESATYCYYLCWSGEYVQSGTETGCRWRFLAHLSFLQVDAVTRTSVTLPVKERIAEGLSRAGLSNTLKVVGYNSVLGTIARCSTGAISQFCTFAVVVLVAHWFLAHTFFLAVLSIDIQRLEVSNLAHTSWCLIP